MQVVHLSDRGIDVLGVRGRHALDGHGSTPTDNDGPDLDGACGIAGEAGGNGQRHGLIHRIRLHREFPLHTRDKPTPSPCSLKHEFDPDDYCSRGNGRESRAIEAVSKPGCWQENLDRVPRGSVRQRVLKPLPRSSTNSTRHRRHQHLGVPRPLPINRRAGGRDHPRFAAAHLLRPIPVRSPSPHVRRACPRTTIAKLKRPAAGFASRPPAKVQRST